MSGLTVEKPDFFFPDVDVDAIFSLLPENPSFYSKGNFKSILLKIYKTLNEEADSLFGNEYLPSTFDSNFSLYYDEVGNLKGFIAPHYRFMLYFKSKSSRLKYAVEYLNTPEFDKNINQYATKQKEGMIIAPDLFFEYFFNIPENAEIDKASASSMFFYKVAKVAIALVRSSSFVPEPVENYVNDFYIRYIPLLDNDNVKEVVEYLKSIAPPGFLFSKDLKLIYNENNVLDILALFITHAVHKLTFLKSAKIKSDGITTVFTKNRHLRTNSIQEAEIAKSIRDWIEILSIKNKNISFNIIVEPLEKTDTNTKFSVNVQVIDRKNPQAEGVPLAALFTCEENIFNLPIDQIKEDLVRQINVISNYLPVLQEILNTKGTKSPVIGPTEILRVISASEDIFDKFGIRVLIPEELKTIAVPRIYLKTNFKDASNSVNFSDFSVVSNLQVSDLLDFSYEIAIGDEKITKEEFIELVSQSENLVRFKDRFVVINRDDINSILQQIDKPPPKLNSILELIHSGYSGIIGDVYFEPDEAVNKVINDLTRIEEIEVPSGLTGELRHYQERGFKWLYSNSIKGFGSCLADDMGLGKTVQVITLLLKIKEDWEKSGKKVPLKPALVVCPTTLVGNWYKELKKFAPSIKAGIYHGTERSSDFSGIDVLITTYGLLRIDTDTFKENEWGLLIIDEAQNIKNPDTAQTLAVKSINAGALIAMSGTPVENRLTELWSIFDFLNKDYLGSLSSFQRIYSTPIEKNRDAEKINRLKLVTSPFILRRLKSDKTIIDDLPDKIVADEYCYLTKEQAALYEKTLQTIMKSIETSAGMERRGLIFKLITSLKQICNHPTHYLKSGEINKEMSGKAEKAFSLLETILEQNEKAIIFTQYREMGDLLVRMIKKEFDEDALFFHGGVTRLKRDKMVEDFQSIDKIKLMVISLKAGGTGLNLTAATNVIHYDLWWNPAVEEQATDRTYRIGQTKNIFVHRLITLGTFEEKIDEIIKSKKELASLTVSTGEKWISELSDRDLRDLFRLTKEQE